MAEDSRFYSLFPFLRASARRSPKRTTRRKEPRAAIRARLGFESLEDRRVLATATDLSLISGRVFSDLTGNGYNAGEEVAGATVNLYRDDGDGNFEPGTGDTLVTTTVSGADGRYQFSGLTAAGYFVQQPAQTVAGRTLAQAVSPRINISATDVQGRKITTIDTFDTTTQLVIDDSGNGTPVTNSVAAPEAIGGERDLLVNKTSANGTVQISVNNPGLPGLFTFDSILSGQGQWNVSWDGVDGNAQVINDNGLAGLDITSGGTATGLQFQIGADVAGGQATIRVYSNDSVPGTASRFSSTNLLIPATGGAASSFEYIPFSAFAATSGGGANFAQIGAIEMEITGPPNINGAAELVGAVGPTIFTQDFSNFQSADLSLTKTVSNATPSTNENFTFTITVNNSGPNGATGVVVTDLLPAGLNFVSATASQGTYSNTTGLWTVGSVANAGAASLQIVANATTPGAKVNTAQITASDQTDPDSTPNNNASTEDDQATATVTPAAIDLSLTKSLSNPTPRTGDNITYAITVSNAGPSGATGVVVSDPLPTGVAFVSATPSQGTFNSGTGVWTVGSIANAGSATLSLVGRVTGTGTITNVAQVIAADQTDINSTPNNNNPAENDQASTTFTIAVADLSLNKAVNNPTANVGENVTFTVTLNNAGPSTATGVSVRDQLPAGLTFISSTPSQGTYDAGTGIWQVGSVNATANSTLQLVARVDALGAKTNVAEVIASDQFDNDSTPNNNVTTEDDRAAVSLTPASADLSLTKVVNDATPNVGQNVTFTITVSNAGPNAATGISVRDQLPAETTFVSATASAGTYNQATGIWTIGNLNNGSNATLQLVAVANAIGLTTNVAEIITADQFDPDSTPGNNAPGEDDQASASITPELIDLSVTKTVNNPAANRGENVTFTVTVANAGPSNATGVVLTDRLDSGLTFVSATPSQGSYNTSTGVWTVGNVANGASPTLQLVARVDRTGTLNNRAEITAAGQTDSDSTPGNNSAAEDDQATAAVVTPSADLSLEKTVDNATPNLNEQVTFTVTVTNAGPDRATGIRVTDTLPEGVTLVSNTVSQGTFANTGVWTVGELGLGETATLNLIARVTTRGAKVNTAQITAVNQADPDSTPNNNVATEDDQDSVTITPQVADLSLTKTIDQARPNVGDNVTFRLTVNNAGPNPATGVAVLDLLPAGTSFVSAVTPQGSYDSTTGIWTVGAVPVGAPVTLDLVARVDTPGAKTNIAEISQADQFDNDSTPGNGVATEDDRATVVLTPAAADLSLTKTASTTTPNVGENVTFTITVNNAGPDNATGVSVRDQLPAGVSFVSATTTVGTYDNTTGIWTLGNIGNGGNATLRLVGTADSVGNKINTAEIVASDRRDPDSTPDNGVATEDDQASVTITPQQIDLSLAKTVDNVAPNVGENVTFTLTVSNAGPSNATGVVVTDRLPTGVSFVSAVASQGTFNSVSGQWTVGNVTVGATPTLRIIARVNQNGTLTNSAEITAAGQPDLDSTPGNAVPTEDDFATVDFITQTADLSLTKTVDNATPLATEVLTFTITVSNAGPNDAVNVVVRDQLPTGLVFVSAAGDGSYNNTTGRWTVGNIPNGGTATLALAARATAPGTKTNVAEIFAVQQFDPDSTPNNNVASEDDQAAVDVTPQTIDLSVTSSVDNEEPAIGDIITITYTAANAGPNAATGVQLRNSLPAGLTFISANPSTGTYDSNTGIWSLGGLAVGNPATLELDVRVDTFGFKRDRIEVIAADQIDVDSTPANGVVTEDDLAELVIRAPRILNKRLFLSR